MIDVATQTESGLWTLAQWVKYYETPIAARTAVCNVISLEISKSDYARTHIEPPRFVRELDWMKAWPTEAHGAADAAATIAATPAAAAASSPSSSAAASPSVSILPPAPVQLYCLMGTAGSYTDFHCDFGGSSVWYHVVKGRKIFLLVEPTAPNLAVYEKWHQNGAKQHTTFLGDLYEAQDRAREASEGLAPNSIHTVRILTVEASQTLFVPSGWIHAVYTPLDSLVFGGNFLHGFHIGSQLLVYNLELNTQVAARFQFPQFEALHWIWMRNYVFKLRQPFAQMHITLFELHGLATLVKTAANWLAQCAQGAQDGYDAARPRRGSKQPPGFVADPESQLVSNGPVLDWAHNLPIAWNDAVMLLRELDCLLLYNTYLLEREDFEDRMERRAEGPNAARSSPRPPTPEQAELSAEGWAHREQVAQRCFQMLESFRPHTYPIVPMVHVNTLPFLRKPTKRRSVQRMTAADSAAAIARATRALKPKRARPTPAAAMEEDQQKAAPAPTASGRVRQHVAKYKEFVSDEDEDEDEGEKQQDANMSGGEEKSSSRAAVAPSSSNASFAAAGSSSAVPAASASSSSSSAKRRRSPSAAAAAASSGSDDDAYSSDDASSAARSESDEEFETEGKRKPKKAKKTAGATAAGAAAASASSSAAPPLKLSDIRARAAAAAAASMSASKKVIPAGAPAPKPRAKSAAKPTAAQAAAAAALKPKPPSLSAKQRIMQRLGLSGKLR